MKRCMKNINAKHFIFSLIYILILIFPVFSDVSNDVEVPSLGTGAWDGIYIWDNPTEANNRGKCTQIVFQVKEVQLEDGQYSFEVFDASSIPTLRRIFPVEYMPEDGYQWHKWDEDSSLGDNYRTNAKKFNTTSVSPTKWRVKYVKRDGLTGSCKIETIAFIFTVNTENYFTLRINSQTGAQELAFTMDGDSIASLGLFYNPAPGDEGKKVFVLTKEKSLE